MVNKSALFATYNSARVMAREGHLDAGRLNRALGIAQRTSPAPYARTATSCNCPDKRFRPWTTCKHQIAAILKEVSQC